MIADTTTQFCLSFLRHLLEPAIRSLLVAGVAAMALWLLRIRNLAHAGRPALQFAVWTSALYAALAMPFLGSLLPPLPLRFPHRFVTHSEPRQPAVTPVPVAGPTTVQLATKPAPPLVSGSPTEPFRRAEVPWPVVAVGLYALLVALGLMWLGLGWLLARRVWRTGRAIDDPRAQASLAQQARATGLKRAPALAQSEAVVVPVTLGLWPPTVLLPAGWREWEERKLEAVLAHELSHVARHDYLTQMLAAIHRCFFWFSPFAWWLERHLSELAEQVSDDSALASGAEACGYAEVLLGFLGARDGAQGRVRWSGVAMARCGKAGRRLERVLSSRGRISAQLTRPAWFAVVLCAASITCLLAAARPSIYSAVPLARSAAALQPPPAASANTAQQAPGPPSQPEPGAPAKPAAARPATPAPAQAPSARLSTGIESGTDSYIFICGGGRYMSNTDNRELERIEALRAKLGKDIIWIRHAGKPYLIRDEATIRKARELWTNYEVQEAQWRTKIAGIELEQAKLGAQHAEVRVAEAEGQTESPELAEQLQKVEAQLKRLHEGSSLGDFEQAQAELNLLLAKLREMEATSLAKRAQSGAEEATVREATGDLRAQRDEIWKQVHGTLGEAHQKMVLLITRAIADGLALPEATAVK
jgi:beta-lactamase regulating signal transducer with metallopeptidase domain